MPAASRELASSTSTVASLGLTVSGGAATFVVHVRDGQHRRTLTGPSYRRSFSYPYFAVSGHWVLYTQAGDHQAGLLNAVTGQRKSADVPADQAATIADGHLVFQKSDGSVWERPPGGGSAHKVFTAPRKLNDVGASLIVNDGHVAAYYNDNAEDDPVPGPFVRARALNLQGSTRKLNLHGETLRRVPLSVTPSGLIFETGSYPTSSSMTETTILRRWSNATPQILFSHTYHYTGDLPSDVGTEGAFDVSGHRLAWIDPAGIVHETNI